MLSRAESWLLVVKLRFVFAGAVLLATTLLCAQKSPQRQLTPLATLRSNSRLVVVDVVVTGKNDAPVTDLRAEELTIFEDGKPQQLSAFEPHMIKAIPRANDSSVPPNHFTNELGIAPDAPINILLIDAVNSSWLNQAATRKAIVHFITTLPPGQPMAIFVLGDRLRMIQDFTMSSDELIRAALAYKPETSDTQTVESSASSAIRVASKLGGAPGERLKIALGMERALNMRDRFEEAISAFKQISRAVSGYSGRKNVVWLSGSFPLDVRPQSAERAGFQRNENFAIELREVTQLMCAAKLSIYPVDIRGISTSLNLADESRDRNLADENRETLEIGRSIVSDEIAAMRVLADETGGRAFFNRNDIDTAMSKAVELGSSYYTLAYTPRNTKWNGNFRDIKIEVNRRDVKLAYRKGYYAVDAPRQFKRLEQDVQLAMIDGSPNATGIILRATVVARKPDGTTVVAYAIPGTQLQLRDKDNRPFATRHAFGVMGFDQNGKRAGMGSEVWDLPDDAELVAKMEREGWVHRQTVKINPEAVRLRVAVQDQSTGRIGTVDIPLMNAK